MYLSYFEWSKTTDQIKEEKKHKEKLKYKKLRLY